MTSESQSFSLLPGPPARVTVIVSTYNHERFICQALDSILAQQTSFRFEVVILEDCSTDRTRELVIGYQKAHPDKIRLALSETNRYDNVIFMEVARRINSEYVALLDGDDFWTSPQKLERQVEFLDAHRECAICFHQVILKFEDGSQPDRTDPESHQEISTLVDLLEGCFMNTGSVMFRRSAILHFPARFAWEYSADWALFVLAAKNGFIGYLDEPMSVYRKTASGVWTALSPEEQRRRIIAFYEGARDYVPPDYSGTVTSLLARNLFEMGFEHSLSGDHERARDCYFKAFLAESDLRKLKWTLRVARSGSAKLEFPSEPHDGAVRVQIARLPERPSFNLQLNQGHFHVRRDGDYKIRFAARADGSRSMLVGLAHAQEPWTGLGLYQRVELTSDWANYEFEVTATEGETNARVHFDLGESEVPVEVAALSVTDAITGENVSLYQTAEAIADSLGKLPLVSVVLIFRNSAANLRQAIESVITQNYLRWELLLVDDGSIDGSTEIALEYTRKYAASVSYFEHGGHLELGDDASRRLGIGHARGEHVMFLGGHEVWPAGTIAANRALACRGVADSESAMKSFWEQ
jgi:glycosyltransferase involved in cell wall biosynthesis